MSSREEPPRKKQKQESSNTRILRSQGTALKDLQPGSKRTTSSTPRRSEKVTSNTKGMSDSRRRSSRKNRNAELKDNEQTVAGSASAKSTPTRKQSSHSGTSRKYVADHDEDEDELDQDIEEDMSMDDTEDHDDMADEPRPTSSHKSGFNNISLSAMASLLTSSQSSTSTLKSLLNSLRQPDPSIQLVALSELANLLSMSTEESLIGYNQIDGLVVELVSIMRGPDVFGEDNPEMMLLACRCLANLMEAMPSATANIAYSGAIPVLCQKLLEIEFIDVAEQSLSTLEKISKDYPGAVVREGGMAACLTYLDFFSTNVQRTAVATAANCAKNVPQECFSIVKDVTPRLQDIITGSDAKVVEAACLCLTRLLESFRNNGARLEQLLLPDLLPSVLTVISSVQSSGIGVSDYIKTRLIHILALAARCSPEFSAQLLQRDIIGIIYLLLTGLSKPSTYGEIEANSVVVLQALINRPRDQVTEIIALLSDVLPGLPDIELFSGLSQNDRGSDDSRSIKFGQDCPGEFEDYATIVLPTLMDMFNSTINIGMRKVSLVALLKICYNVDIEILKRVVNDVPLAAFITGVLGTSEAGLVLSGVRLAYILLDRVQEVYLLKLATEGCVAELRALAQKYSITEKKSMDEPLGDPTEEVGRSLDGVDRNGSVDLVEAVIKAGDAIADDADDIDDNQDDDQDDDVDEEDQNDDEDDDDDGGDDDDEDEEDDYDDLLDDGIDDFDQEPGFQKRPLSAATFASSALSQDASSLDLISTWANRFVEKYSSLSAADDPQGDLRLRLEAVARDLKPETAAQAFENLADLFASTSEISSYLLRTTGVLSALLKILTDTHCAFQRIGFLEHFMHSPSLAMLVTKLQELLTWSERFDVVTTSASEDKRSPNILAKQVRLKLVADQETDIPKAFRNLMVSVHAIATFKALDDYLRPRLNTNPLAGSGRLSRTPTPTSSSSQRGSILGRAPESLQGVLGQLGQLAAAGTSLPESIRERLAGLGIDPSTFLKERSDVTSTPQAQVDYPERSTTSKTDGDDVEDAGPAVSVEISASGGKAVARTAEGQRIPTPRTHTPQQFQAKSEMDSKPSQVPDQDVRRTTGMSYAAALSTVPKDWHLQFEVGGKVLSHDTTIFGAINAVAPIGDASSHGRPSSLLYEITYRKVPGPAPMPIVSVSESSLEGALPASVVEDSETALVLQLLDVLYSLNSNLLSNSTRLPIHKLPAAAFVSTKLTAKLNRQLEEPLIVASQSLPAWAQDLPRYYPFLFPFETRYLFLQSTSFGYSRSMARWQAAAKKEREDSRSFLGRLQRQKVRISRPRMFESATRVMELYGASPSVLEVEYFDEVGTGLGPTLEFYSTVSKEISRKKYNLWRDQESSSESEFVFASSGLFPSPIAIIENEQNIESYKRTMILFRTIGIFLARSLLDSRLVDISFNPLFFKLLAGKEPQQHTIGTIRDLDKRLANSLSLLEEFSARHSELLADQSLSSNDRAERAKAVRVNDVSIDELGLDFTYPGRPDLELKPNGAQFDVTIENVSDYLAKVIDLTLGSGIARQCAAFKEGFSQVFPYSALRAFTPTELTLLFGRADEDWSVENIADSVKADHGFTMESTTVRNLLKVLSEMSDLDRRDFLQFITGSPKLPIGGFKSLTPQLTIVCKPHETPLTANDYLPSVMTCVNYLKLPDYSSAEVLKTRLLTAMREGGGSFHLS